jgi:hypothetical protein
MNSAGASTMKRAAQAPLEKNNNEGGSVDRRSMSSHSGQSSTAKPDAYKKKKHRSELVDDDIDDTTPSRKDSALQFSPDAGPCPPSTKGPQKEDNYKTSSTHQAHHSERSQTDSQCDDTPAHPNDGKVLVAENQGAVQSNRVAHQSPNNVVAGAFRVSGPGSMASTPFDVDNSVNAANNTNASGTTDEQYLAVAETVTESPLVDGVPSASDEEIFQRALRAAREGAADERRASWRKLLILSGAMFIIIAIAVIVVAVLLVPKGSNNTTEITEVTIFNNVYQTEQTTQIILAGGGLTGTLPSDLFLLSDLTVLDLSDNSFTGTLPLDLAKLSKLAQIDLSDNSFSGEIPSEYGEMSQITELSLHGNKGVTGSIPSEFSNLIGLSVLWLYDTDLSGSIPASLCTLPGPSDFRIDCGKIKCECCTDSENSPCDSSTLAPPSSTDAPLPPTVSSIYSYPNTCISSRLCSLVMSLLSTGATTDRCTTNRKFCTNANSNPWH